MATQQLAPSTPKTHHIAATPTSVPAKGNTSILSHQNIKDSLPKEVIDRIKVSYDMLFIYFNIKFSNHNLFFSLYMYCAKSN
jgi:hypothetical protein